MTGSRFQTGFRISLLAVLTFIAANSTCSVYNYSKQGLEGNKYVIAAEKILLQNDAQNKAGNVRIT